MHTADARKMKVSEEEIYLLNAWDDTNVFSEKAKLAFKLAEAITHISKNGVPDKLYDEVRTLFSEEEYTDLVLILLIKLICGIDYPFLWVLNTLYSKS